MRVIIVLLVASTACFAQNKTCDFCWGRGYLSYEANPVWCQCVCQRALEPVIDGTEATRIRQFNGSANLRLLPPTCRYAEIESVRYRATFNRPPVRIVSSVFFASVRRFLVLQNDDQLVLHFMNITETAGTTMEFDLREDGTGHNYTVAELAIITPLDLHKLNMQDAMSRSSPPPFVADFGLTTLLVVEAEDSPLNIPSPVIGHLGSYPIYLESAIVLATVVIFSLVLALLEASLSSNFDSNESWEAERVLERKKSQWDMNAGPKRRHSAWHDPDELPGPRRASSQADYIPDGDDAGWGGEASPQRKTPPPQPVQPVAGRRSTFAASHGSGGEFDGSEQEPVPLQRKPTRAKSFYYMGS